MKLILAVFIILFSCITLFADDVFRYDSQGRRDPFVPLVSKDGVQISDAQSINGIKDVRLEGIVWDGGPDSIAIVNGEIVKAGDKIGSIEVLKIEDHAVIFIVNGDEVRIQLEQD